MAVNCGQGLGCDQFTAAPLTTVPGLVDSVGSHKGNFSQCSSELLQISNFAHPGHHGQNSVVPGCNDSPGTIFQGSDVSGAPL